MAEDKKTAAPVIGPEHVIELRIENFKVFKAARLVFNETGVTRLVGKNGAGKTTVLDAIMATLCGRGHVVEAPVKKGEKRAKVTVELTKIVVTRTWTGDKSTVEVRNKEGHVFAGPQALLDQLILEVAFDPLRFAQQTAKQQAETLAGLAGFDVEKWKAEYDTLFVERKAANKRHTDAAAVLRSIPEVDAPDKPVDTAALVGELNAATAANKAADQARQAHRNATATAEQLVKDVGRATAKINAIRKQLTEAEEERAAAETAQSDAAEQAARLKAEVDKAATVDTSPLTEKIAQAGEVNKRVQAKKDRAAKVEQCYALEKEADTLSDKIKAKMDERTKALAAVKLGVDGLAVDEAGECQYQGLPLSSASTAEQLRVGVAIAIALNPMLKLCHVQDGSLLDDTSMVELDKLAQASGFQVFVERVANAGEVSIIIENGEVLEEATK